MLTHSDMPRCTSAAAATAYVRPDGAADFNGNAHRWEPRARSVDGPASRSFVRFTGTLCYATASGLAEQWRIVDASTAMVMASTLAFDRSSCRQPAAGAATDATNCHVLLPEEEDSVPLGTAISASSPRTAWPSDAAQARDGVAPTSNPTPRRPLFADPASRMQDHGLERRQVEGCGKPKPTNIASKHSW
jgi:hypothetical protein